MNKEMKPCLVAQPLMAKKIWKNYVTLIPADAEEDENGEVEIKSLFIYRKRRQTEGDLQPIPGTQMQNGIWSKKSSIALWRVKTSVDVLLTKKLESDKSGRCNLHRNENHK